MTDINTTKPPYAQEEEYPYAIQVDEPVTPPAQSAPMPEDREEDVDGRQEIMVGRWEVGFCSCCTDCVPNCCMVTFCPCVSLAQISVRLGIAPYECSLITLVLLMVLMVLTLGSVHLVSFVPFSQVVDHCCVATDPTRRSMATAIISKFAHTSASQPTYSSSSSDTMTDATKSTPTPKHDDSEHPYTIQVDAPLTPPGTPDGGRTFKDEDVEDIRTGHWESTLWCGCFKHLVPNCCMVTFCPCVTHAQISARLGMASYWCALVTLFILIVMTGGTVHVILFVWIWYLRAQTRERFQIPGGCIRDCCASLFCPCCTLAQMATHLKSYKPGSCDFGPPDTLPPYSQRKPEGTLNEKDIRRTLGGSTLECENSLLPMPEKELPVESEFPYAVRVQMDSEIRTVSFANKAPTRRASKRRLIEDHYGVAFGRWDSGLFACFTHCVPNGLMATFCPCVALAQIVARLGVITYSSALLAFFTLTAIVLVSLGFALTEVLEDSEMAQTYMTAHRILNDLVSLLVIISVWYLRSTTRRRFEIPGSCCGDLWTSACCFCCATAQMASHLKSYTPGSCDFRGVEELPAYQRE
ncbi:hypothetical protein BBJ28_00007311 [Nothophytophthora sp. Chile5]|nr:hypothetical protein BBJ28_00007311 [Nothophytophthora sp. Chile5]